MSGVWFWIIILVVLFTIGGIGSGGNAEDPVAQKMMAKTETSIIESNEKVVEDIAPSEPSLTMGQKNALNSAYTYLDSSAFSYSGLIEQLEYEGYSNSDAVYAVDNSGADWNEQAAKSANTYLKSSSFSRQGLIEQLMYEGFSSDQAAYGVSAVGY